MVENNKPSAYEVFKGVKSSALSYDFINREKETGRIKEPELRGYAAQVAPDQAVSAYLQDKNTPINELYPFIEAGSKRFNRVSDKMGSEKLEAIVDSTPKKNLRMGMDNIRPDPQNAGEFADAAKNHKKYLAMNGVLAVYQDKDAEDKDREKASKTILKTIKDHYNSEISDDEPEIKEATNWLIENSQLFAPNRYAMMFQEAQHKFGEAVQGKEKKYLKTVLSNDEQNRERFYQAIMVDPKESGEQSAAA